MIPAAKHCNIKHQSRDQKYYNKQWLRLTFIFLVFAVVSRLFSLQSTLDYYLLLHYKLILEP